MCGYPIHSLVGCCCLRTLAVTADLDNFSICGRVFYSLPNSAVTTNCPQKFDFTADLDNNKDYWVTTHVQSFYVVKILLTCNGAQPT